MIHARLPDGNETANPEPVAHWIAAIRGERRLGVSIVRCRGELVQTARSAVVFAQSLLDDPPGGGCFDPEEVCTLEDLGPMLQAAGISIIPGEVPLRSRTGSFQE